MAVKFLQPQPSLPPQPGIRTFKNSLQKTAAEGRTCCCMTTHSLGSFRTFGAACMTGKCSTAKGPTQSGLSRALKG